ncbi:response regulator transcription factor [Thomasclavelia saccharogumia]|uniref:response regulator transcription factor n=1 Tax=Thomasclavelia saccharogumia TaxID=341225 RepID=UPI00047E0FAE|nr:response regulator [Thomasclavelia saccharogumia]
MYNVIIADDEKIIREFLKNELNWHKLGFNVKGVAANGMEALELVEEYQPDLLLTDIQMPYISGIELARRVREVNPFMDIAFLTAFEEFTYAKKAIQYSVISYILKSQSKEELEQEIWKIKNKLDEKYSQHIKLPNTPTEILYEKRKNILKDIFFNHHDQSIDEKLTLLEFYQNDKNNNYLLMLIKPYSSEILINEQLINSIINDILKRYGQFISFTISNKILIFIDDDPKNIQHYKQLIADEILQGLKKVLNINVRICISQPFSNISELIKAYNSMLSAFKTEIESPIVYAENINIETPDILAKKAIQIIEEEYSNPFLSVIDISERLHISTSYLSILLKKIYSSSFVKLLTAKRMTIAKNYLLNTNLKILEISELCGYNDQHYFSYCFKRHYGISPKKAREINDEKI